LTSDPGLFKGDLLLTVDLTSAVPVRKRCYDLPLASKQIVEREVQSMLSQGIIEHSKSSYSSPVVLVGKKDGSTRFCVDYRALNKVTHFDAEPIPNPDELFARLADGTYFTKIDLSKGYWQILIDPVDRYKTAFATHIGLYQWIRMPFGLVAAPAVFARMMRMLHLEEVSAENFFDDILVHSRTWDEHIKHVRGVMQKLADSGLTARPSKISAGFQELEFLGHVVGKGCIHPEDGKLRKILSIPTPTTKKQVRSVLGLLSYYRRYVPNFATLTAPLTELTKQNKRQIVWTAECADALKQIQQILSLSPVLLLPRVDQQFIVRTDASSVGVGAVLMQESHGDIHPVLYASRKLLEREQRYSTIERECLAIVWAISKFAKYLWGTYFLLQTDHKPLVYLRTSSFKNSRLMRWALALQEFTFEIESLPGSANVLADLLSRSCADQMIP
jgi:hypothetical protein